MNVAEALAERIASFRFSDLPDEAIYWAKVAILDTIGVTLAGSIEPSTSIIRRIAVANAAGGSSLILGTPLRTTALEAALINGTAAHALDFDCSSSSLAGHPAIHVLPAILALAEERGAGGRELITAFVAGLETQARIARGAQPQHFWRGWFPSSTIGIFGTAAATANILGLSPGQTAQALGISSMFAAGIMANAGTMSKPLSAGHTARSGLFAALAAAEGFTGATDAIEDRRGFLAVYNGPKEYDTEAILPDWGRPLDILQPGIVIKQYPCCGILHASIDVLSEMVARHSIDAESIERIDVLLHPQRIGHVNRPDPQSDIDAKFSAQYCLALTVVHGRPRLADFEDSRHLDEGMRKLMRRIHVAVDPAADPVKDSLGDQFGTVVTLVTKDGERYSDSLDKPLGRGPEKPLPDDLLHSKFSDCAGRVLRPETIGSLIDRLRRLETVSVADLTTLMQPDPIHSEAKFRARERGEDQLLTAASTNGAVAR